MKCLNIRCSKEHNGDYGSGKYCTRSCANSRNWNDSDKAKISNTAKTSNKVKAANKIINTNKIGKIKTERIENFCPVCKQGIITTKYRNKRYHKDCWYKVCGGYKIGSSRGKSGYYNGYWCDSSYELAFIIYSLDHGVKVKRNNEGFPYIFNGKHLFYPDFIINDQYIEIKNYKSEITDAKINQFPKSIIILYKEDLEKAILPYVIAKYGKDFIKNYEV